MREELSNVNERLVSEMTHALMKRVVLRSEIRAQYEEKIVIDRGAFTTAKKRVTEQIQALTSICDKRKEELELLTAELSASFVAFYETAVAEVASAKVALEDSHDSTLLDQANYFGIKHAKELANASEAYEVQLARELERVEDAFTRKVCIAESVFQNKLAEEKDASDTYYLKYKQYKDKWQTLKVKTELARPPQGGVACVLTDMEGVPPLGIEVVDAVEDLAKDEVEREGEQSLEVIVPSANVNGTNHPKVAPSHDDELAQVKRQCDKLKEALAREKEQRQTVHNHFLTRTEGNFELRKENKGYQKKIRRLQKENARLEQRPPSEEDRFMEGKIERARRDLCQVFG
jgi:hypothetical protein